MKASLSRWLRAHLPRPFENAVVFLVGVGLIQVALLAVEPLARQGGDEKSIRLVLGIRDFWLLFWATGYGAYRVADYHPLSSIDYRLWLQATPWTSRLPLPLGSVYPVWRDIPVLGVFLICQWGSPLSPLYLPIAMCLGYALVAAVTFCRLNQRYTAYAIFFSLGLLFVDVTQPAWGCAGAALCVPLTLWGLRQSLRRFPWPEIPEERLNRRLVEPNEQSTRVRQWKVGYPWDLLAPTRKFSWCPRVDALCLAALVAWWGWLAECFSVTVVRLAKPNVPLDLMEALAPPALISVLICMFACFRRILLYMNSFNPPVNFWGRLALGRLIIPGYDKLYAASSLGILCLVGPAIAGAGGWLPPTAVVPVILFLVTWCLLSMGPTFRDWELTGHHQLAETGYSTGSGFLQL